MYSWHSCLRFLIEERSTVTGMTPVPLYLRQQILELPHGQLCHVTLRENLHALKKKKGCNNVRQLHGSCLTKLPSETLECSAVDTLLKRPSPAECHILWPIHKLRGKATTKGLETRVEERGRRVDDHVVYPSGYYYTRKGPGQ